MKNQIITINQDSQDQRLDKFLAENLPDITRSQIKKMILAGLVLVNDEPASVHRFLRLNDQIKILPPKEPKKEIIKTEKITEKIEVDLFDQIKIIEDNDNFLVIEKPAGLLVHPTEKNETNTLVDWLIKNYKNISKIGEDPNRPALVHRLDKEVSGLMVIPKTQADFDHFKNLFKLRELTKKYTALVYGNVLKDEGEIDFSIIRSKNKSGLFAALPKNNDKENAKPALTIFSTKQRFRNYSLLEIQIMTGRTHQIRVHLLAYGNPIVGDKLYFNKRIKDKEKKPLSRIFLHASQLAFTDINGKTWDFNSPLPTELQNFLEQLG